MEALAWGLLGESLGLGSAAEGCGCYSLGLRLPLTGAAAAPLWGCGSYSLGLRLPPTGGAAARNHWARTIKACAVSSYP